MTATYDPANAAPDNADYVSAVRFIIQDTDEATAEISDEEITALYTTSSEDDVQAVRNYTTAVAIARALHRRYGKQATFTSGKTSIQHTDRAKYWATIVEEIHGELQAAQVAAGAIDKGGVIYAGRSTSFNDQMGLDLGGFGINGGFIE